MNHIKHIILLLAFLSFIISQSISDSKSESVDFYSEILYPAFRRHRARLRPFSKLLGAPINKIRAARNVKETIKKDLSECVYSLETLFCSGNDSQNTKINFECSASLNLNQTNYEKLNHFLIGYIQIKSNEPSKLKLNIYTMDKKESNISIHLKKDDLNEDGIDINDQSCWSKMIEFFIHSTQNKLWQNDGDNDDGILATLKIL
ncbi:unnamed protein product [Brachionus calyciflorus]|uniref:Uncharacterized protein n=1 Tax=Brachionus calyciflorus TaxID=104777 RepID=A0A813RUY7_9BILA|nr:unnamed protein product [Brachionus calyciflorus]